jgi:glycosyltransferase involved in cell wall biosynthesis
LSASESNRISAPAGAPLVSVVTPVFNGAKYLRACIESVLAQSYGNWDYTIVDNCSTDGSLEIARAYAEKHSQITLQRNESFVGAIENHNRAVRSISPQAKYCKVLSADDWMYRECIEKLVDVAERYPSVGLVSSYAASAAGVRWGKLPLDREVFPGREAVRSYLLGAVDSFWTPSTVLYRASLVRSSQSFFPGSAPSADLEAAIDCLKQSDLGFVHQILSFERIHDEATTAKVRELNTQLLDRLRILLEVGPHFLTPDEFERRKNEQLAVYYHELAVGIVNFRDEEYWSVHKQGLASLGYSLFDRRFVKALAAKILDLALNPKATAEKLVRRVKSRRLGGEQS